VRRVLYGVILASLLFVPLNRVNVGELVPIEAVAVYMYKDSVVLETDAEHTGYGKNAEEALESLKKNTAAVVYLDTAEYLLVSQDAVSQVEGLRPYLKPSVRVCICEAKGKVKDAAKYIEVHQKLPKLKDWQAEEMTE